MASILTSAQLATAKQIVGYLTAPPAAWKVTALPSNSAIAAAGNAGQESSYNPLASGDGGVSKGLWQWQGSRLTERDKWCAANGLDPNSVEGQCAFFLYELPTSDGMGSKAQWLYDTSNKGQPARSLATLTADICEFYERPSLPDLDNRIAYANQVAASLGAIYTPPTATPTPVSPIPTTPTAPTTGTPSMDPAIIATITQFAPVFESFVAGIFRGAGASLAPAIPGLISQLTGIVPTAAAPTIDLNALATSLTPIIDAQFTAFEAKLPGLIAAEVAKLVPAKV